MNLTPLLVAALAAFALPGGLGYLLTRRFGLPALWVVLAATAVLGIVLWNITRTPRMGEEAIASALWLFFTTLPATVGLVLGAALGLWRHTHAP